MPCVAHATVWYACTSGGNWSSNVWTSVSADQGTCAAALGTPVAGDTATLNSSSGNITITAAAAAASLTMTGYTGTLGASSAETLTVTGGTVTLATGNTISSNITLASGTETWGFGSQVWPGPVTVSSAATITNSNGAATNTIGGLLTLSGASTLNHNAAGDGITMENGLTIGGNETGTATLFITGGTWSGNFPIASSMTLIPSFANITVSGLVGYANGTLSYTSSTDTVTTTGSTLQISQPTLNTNGLTWNIISVTHSGQVALTSALQATTFEVLGSADYPLNFSGAFNQTFANLYLYNPITSGLTFKIVTGQTMNVTNSLMMLGDPTQTASLLFESSTTTNATLNYTGTQANVSIIGMNFTHITATNNLNIWQPGTLTSSTGFTSCINGSASNSSLCGGTSGGAGSNGYAY